MRVTEVIFDGDYSLNELVEELMESKNGDEVTGICQLEGKYEGFELEVTIRKSSVLDA